MRSLFFVLLLACGCGRVVYPGNGPLVVVEVTDGDLEELGVDAVVRGCRMWDAVGARVRLGQALSADEAEEEGARLPLGAAGDLGGLAGEYSYAEGWVLLTFPTDATRVAHEVGHAIGLDHVLDPRSVMYHADRHAGSLSEADEEEWRRVWGGSAED